MRTHSINSQTERKTARQKKKPNKKTPPNTPKTFP